MIHGASTVPGSSARRPALMISIFTTALATALLVLGLPGLSIGYWPLFLFPTLIGAHSGARSIPTAPSG
jgi:hypothetical protein